MPIQAQMPTSRKYPQPQRPTLNLKVTGSIPVRPIIGSQRDSLPALAELCEAHGQAHAASALGIDPKESPWP